MDPTYDETPIDGTYHAMTGGCDKWVAGILLTVLVVLIVLHRAFGSVSVGVG